MNALARFTLTAATLSGASTSARSSTPSPGRGGTERTFSGAYWKHKDPGAYCCVCCGADPFSSKAKFDLAPDGPALGKV